MATLTPTIVFTVNLSFLANEAIFAKPNESVVAAPAPDIYRQHEDVVAANQVQNRSLRSTWIQGMDNGSAKIVKHGDTFTKIGREALYYKNTYGIGYATDASRAILTVNSITN